MFCVVLTCLIHVVFFRVSGAVRASVTANQNEVTQGATLQLSCRVDETLINARARFILNGNLKAYVNIPGTCVIKTVGEPAGSTKYATTDCSTTGATLLVNNITLAEHNNNWSCVIQSGGDTGPCLITGSVNPCTSGSVIVFVIVPAQTVSIKNDGKVLGTSIVQFREDIHSELTCDTGPDGSRPAAALTWKRLRDPGADEDIKSGVTSESTTVVPGQTDMVVSSSRLQVNFRRYNNWKIYCEASNSGGSVTSAIVTLDVQYPPTLEIQIGNVRYGQYDVIEHRDDLELACHVVAGNPAPSYYSWVKDGKTISGQTGSTYRIDTVERSDGGNYTCTATNIVGAGTSPPLHVNVRYLPIISQLVGDGTFDVNATVVLTCTVDGGPDTRISWFRRGTNQPIHSEILNKPGTSRLVLERIQCTQMSAYTCTAENSVGAKQKSVDVLVKCPPMEDKNHPTDQQLLAELGTSVSLEIHVISFRLPTFTWQQVDDSSLGPLGQSTTQVDGDRTSKLTITSLQGFGVYSLTVSNGVPPDAAFHFNISEKAEIRINESDDPASIPVAAAVGIGVSALVVGCVLTALVCRFHRSCRTLLCRDRLYAEAKPDTGEHQYAEVQPGASSTLALQERSPANVGVDNQQETYENL